MLTSKQRSYLRGLANPLPPIMQVGKGGLGDNTFSSLNDALTARELVKVRVLRNLEQDLREIAQTLATESQAEVVQIIGQNITLYRRNPEDPRIHLP